MGMRYESFLSSLTTCDESSHLNAEGQQLEKSMPSMPLPPYHQD